MHVKNMLPEDFSLHTAVPFAPKSSSSHPPPPLHTCDCGWHASCKCIKPGCWSMKACGPVVFRLSQRTWIKYTRRGAETQGLVHPHTNGVTKMMQRVGPGRTRYPSRQLAPHEPASPALCCRPFSASARQWSHPAQTVAVAAAHLRLQARASATAASTSAPAAAAAASPGTLMTPMTDSLRQQGASPAILAVLEALQVRGTTAGIELLLSCCPHT